MGGDPGEDPGPAGGILSPGRPEGLGVPQNELEHVGEREVWVSCWVSCPRDPTDESGWMDHLSCSLNKAGVSHGLLKYWTCPVI